ncbi:hypothetical protein JXM67_07860 [candidate division WOR-3 bacterium]|nr:hypothetical protein [candidate division WOR-3 bacterium]
MYLIIAIVTSLGTFLPVIPYVQWAALVFGVLARGYTKWLTTRLHPI